ncbi:MAG: DNA polymerase III subunit alpha [Planctomycetota bacterium]|nr:DNA polymerase III subunit alpha [Planctomycetota bacterium]
MARSFVHTHVHSDYSLIDGAAKVKHLVDAAVRCEQPAMALTDHGNMCGAIEFYKTARKAGINPLVGIEAYMAPRSRFDRQKNPVAAHHLIIMAQNEVGYRNLIKLSSRAFTEGFYYVPRMDKELLASHNEGLIVQSACLSGEPAYYAGHDDVARATQAIMEMRDILGDRYYLEIQRNGTDGQEKVNQTLLQIGREQNIKVVASQDIHFVDPSHKEAHEVKTCIGMGRTLRDNKLKHAGTLCFRDTDWMYETFKDVPETCHNTVEMAERCNLELDLGTHHLPHYEPPNGQDPTAYFYDLCLAGAKERYGATLSDAVQERMAYEQRVIEEMGFVSYFLVTWDFMNYAREHGIPVGPGRGSAAGSIVSYCLGITNVDPLAYGLIFERFLNPGRISMPDIDIDFCKDGREQVIRYVQDKYGGPDCVSQIITFGRLAARAVIRDVGRVLEVPLRDVDMLAKLVPNGPGASLGGALEADPDLRRTVQQNPEYKRLVDTALKLEGMNRNAGKHAAGVVVANGRLEEFVPLYKVGEDITTQYSMDILEEIGLLKMDFLGLRTLTILATALENIRKGGREPPDLDTLPLDDAETYRMLAEGDALGVFQVESAGMRDLLRKLHPSTFDELGTIVALYRPGPMGSGMVDMYIERKNGREEVTYPHPSLEPILEETKGVVVYQEQVMRITNVLAGFEMSEADNLRKAMGKKKPELLAKFREKFVAGCGKNGMAAADATVIWDQLEHFAGYGFNKSHTVAYGLITYQTAYLKRHFPREYMAALLTCEMADMDKITEYIEEARRMGIDVLPPDVSRSEWEFAVEGENIRYGLAAIKGVGRSAAEAIANGRAPEDGGEPESYASVFDLCERVHLGHVNRSTLESLVKAGALDSTKARRAQVAAVLERALALGQSAAKDRSAGQLGLFGEAASEDVAPDYPDEPEWPERDLLAWEREHIGYYATNHPLAKHERQLRLLANARTADLDEVPDRTAVTLGGMIRALRTSIVRKGRNEGRRMGFFELEDFSGTVECVVFARTYAQLEPLLEPDRIVLLDGKVDRNREMPSLHVDKIVPIEEARRVKAQGVLVRLRAIQGDVLDRLKQTVTASAGELPLVLEFEPEPRTVARVKAGPGWSVEPTDQLLDALDALPEVVGAEFLARTP